MLNEEKPKNPIMQKMQAGEIVVGLTIAELLLLCVVEVVFIGQNDMSISVIVFSWRMFVRIFMKLRM